MALVYVFVPNFVGANLININLFGDQTNAAGDGYGGAGGNGNGGPGGAIGS